MVYVADVAWMTSTEILKDGMDAPLIGSGAWEKWSLHRRVTGAERSYSQVTSGQACKFVTSVVYDNTY